MDYRDVRDLIRREVCEIMEERMDLKDCPQCRRECSMIRVYVESENMGSLGDYKWRCLNCLSLFVEKLVKEE